MGAGVNEYNKKNYLSVTKEGKFRGKQKSENNSYQEKMYDWVEGFITNLSVQEHTFEGETSFKLHVELKDGNEIWELQAGYETYFSRGLLNRLANIDDLNKKLKIEVSPSQFEGKTFVNCLVKHNGTLIPYKYGKDAIPQIETVKVGKKEMKNTEKRDEFFEEILKDLTTKINASKAYNELNAGIDATDDDSDVPF